MILDSNGRPLRRTIGFLGCLAPERVPSGGDLVSAVGFSVPLMEDEDAEDDSSGERR